MSTSCPGGRDPLTLVVWVRALGVEVPLDAVVAFARAVTALPQLDRNSLYWAACATLTRSPDHRGPLDAAFDRWWSDVTPPIEGLRSQPSPPLREESAVSNAVSTTVDVVCDAGDVDEDGEEEGEEQGEREDGAREGYSRAEVLRQRDFATLSSEELAECHRLMRGIRLAPPSRRSSRRRACRGSRGEIDLGRTVRGALATEGDIVTLRRRRRALRPRRLVLLCDVSGSMEAYSRALLRFLHAAVASGPKVEAFTVGTRLTRITRPLRLAGADRALAEAAAAVDDWSGGTRLGACLRQFNDEWGVRGLARGAVVVILSDGWDRGDPETIGSEMARLSRVARRVVWVNPLRASEGYEPRARGMVAALPHVDDFVDGHSLAALEDLAGVVSR